MGREAVPQLLDMVQDRLVALGFERSELLRDCRRQGIRSRRLGAAGLDQGRSLGVEACDRGFGIGGDRLECRGLLIGKLCGRLNRRADCLAALSEKCVWPLVAPCRWLLLLHDRRSNLKRLL